MQAGESHFFEIKLFNLVLFLKLMYIYICLFAFFSPPHVSVSAWMIAAHQVREKGHDIHARTCKHTHTYVSHHSHLHNTQQQHPLGRRATAKICVQNVKIAAQIAKIAVVIVGSAVLTLGKSWIDRNKERRRTLTHISPHEHTHTHVSFWPRVINKHTHTHTP